MNRSYNLDPLDRITAGAVGEPGARTFYVQARTDYELVTIIAEKEQVRLLAEALDQMLDALPPGDESGGISEADLELEEPLDPEWRAGSIAIEYVEAADRIAITITELRADDEPEEPASARLVATRGQCRALAEHAAEVVAAGRPRCQFCGEPIDADGHTCPAMNGHRKPRD